MHSPQHRCTPHQLPRGLQVRRLGVPLCALLITVLPGLSLAPVRADGGIGAIVRSFCLSAFENEMAQSGKKAPQGMAEFACGCVVDRIRDGAGLDAARQDCRALTARRYPL
jgi:hypothetical protein